jgi:DNA modification methylase
MSQETLELGGADLNRFFAELDLCRDKSTLTHGLHPYPAKFIPHIPRMLIAQYAHKGETVFDPMCGSGTTLVEAAAAGFDAVGNDLNPIAALVAKAKTTPIAQAGREMLLHLAVEMELAAAGFTSNPKQLARDCADDFLPIFHRRSHWFQDHVSQELALIKRRIRQLESASARVFAQCTLSAIIVGVSNQESETRWCAKPHLIAHGETTALFASRLRKNLSALGTFMSSGPASVHVFRGDARATGLCDESVGLVVTSPPYANSHDYYLYNKLRMFWLDYNVRPVQRREIGSRHRHSDLKQDVEVYVEEMGAVLAEMRRVLRKSGKAAIVVADAVIRKQFFRMDELIIQRGRKEGFLLHETFSFPHQRFNSVFQKGFGTAAIKTTHVIVFEKPKL